MKKLAYCVLVFFVTGCGIIPHEIPQDSDNSKEFFNENILMFNALGEPVDPKGNLPCKGEPDHSSCTRLHTSLVNYDPITYKDFDKHLNGMMARLSAFPDGKPTKFRRVLIFIHGGMNTQVQTVQRAADLHQFIKDAGYFPIFLNWQSSLATSYKDHLLHRRQGEYWGTSGLGTWAGLVTAPFYLLEDVLRALARLPVVIGLGWRNDLQTGPELEPFEHRDWKKARKIANTFFCKYDHEAHNKEYPPELEGMEDYHCPNETSNFKKIPIWVGRDTRQLRERLKAGLIYGVTFPTKTTISPFLDAMGKSSWEAMQASIASLTHIEHEYTTKELSSKSFHKWNGLLALLKKLKETKEIMNKKGEELEITLVGHSMGSIIANAMIRLSETDVLCNHKKASCDPLFNQVVYMAAACSLRDYETTMFPYMQKHTKVKMFHLTLNEYEESREAWDEYTLGIDFPPRGSLLIWIDNFLARPANELDRTAGRFTNLMLSIHHTWDEIRDRVHIKKFRAGEDSLAPLKHSHFTKKFRFWNPKCWHPDEFSYDEENNGALVNECLQPTFKITPPKNQPGELTKITLRNNKFGEMECFDDPRQPCVVIGVDKIMKNDLHNPNTDTTLKANATTFSFNLPPSGSVGTPLPTGKLSIEIPLKVGEPLIEDKAFKYISKQQE